MVLPTYCLKIKILLTCICRLSECFCIVLKLTDFWELLKFSHMPILFNRFLLLWYRSSKINSLNYRYTWATREIWFAICNLQLQVALALEGEDSKQAALIWTCVFDYSFKWFEYSPMYD